jgi:hypothetical protein
MALERSVRAQQLGEFNVKLLNGLGSEGLADVRAQLAGGAGAAGPPEAGGRPDHTNTAQEDLVCCFTGIGKGTHKSDVNRVQRQAFSRIGRGGKWVEMKKPYQPMCESCTSTLRKHYTGATNSPELAAAFVHEIEGYKCPNCEAWNQGSTAVGASNMVCNACGWSAGKKKKVGRAAPKKKKQPDPKAKGAGAMEVARMLQAEPALPPASAAMLPPGAAMLPPGLPGTSRPQALPAPAGTRWSEPPLGMQLSRPPSISFGLPPPVPRRITGDMPDDLARLLSSSDLVDAQDALDWTRSQNAALMRELSLPTVGDNLGAQSLSASLPLCLSLRAKSVAGC